MSEDGDFLLLHIMCGATSLCGSTQPQTQVTQNKNQVYAERI